MFIVGASFISATCSSVIILPLPCLRLLDTTLSRTDAHRFFQYIYMCASNSSTTGRWTNLALQFLQESKIPKIHLTKTTNSKLGYHEYSDWATMTIDAAMTSFFRLDT
jgi:hypothetical protein